jgi:Fe-S cluster biogenesis protein NfuA
MTSSVEERVERALDVCRPYLRADGGDVQLASVREGGIVELHFRGTCAVCPMSILTLRAGIERAVLRLVPEIKRVESV